jgi:serine/threonine protein kinase
MGLRDGVIKLMDLGSTHHVDQAGQYRGPGTRRYMAPEVLLREKHSKAADIWSLG